LNVEITVEIITAPMTIRRSMLGTRSTLISALVVFSLLLEIPFVCDYYCLSARIKSIFFHSFALSAWSLGSGGNAEMRSIRATLKTIE